MGTGEVFIYVFMFSVCSSLFVTCVTDTVGEFMVSLRHCEGFSVYGELKFNFDSIDAWLNGLVSFELRRFLNSFIVLTLTMCSLFYRTLMAYYWAICRLFGN